ncbi:MAG: hypothetical protein ACE5IL_09665 [Myxococcota bacterium]
MKKAGGAVAASLALSGLSRSNLAERTIRVLHRGRTGNPDVLLVRAGDHPVVVKDFASRPPWMRLAGRILVAREIRAWRALEGLAHVPRLLGRLDALAFCLEYRPGTRLAGHTMKDLPASFPRDLEAAIRAVHSRGVVHLDLSHRSNVQVDRAGRPVLIDFGAAWVLRPGGLPARWLLPWLARVDLRALRKWQRKFSRYRSERATPRE